MKPLAVLKYPPPPPHTYPEHLKFIILKKKKKRCVLQIKLGHNIKILLKGI